MEKVTEFKNKCIRIGLKEGKDVNLCNVDDKYLKFQSDFRCYREPCTISAKLMDRNIWRLKIQPGGWGGKFNYIADVDVDVDDISFVYFDRNKGYSPTRHRRDFFISKEDVERARNRDKFQFAKQLSKLISIYDITRKDRRDPDIPTLWRFSKEKQNFRDSLLS